MQGVMAMRQRSDEPIGAADSLPDRLGLALLGFAVALALLLLVPPFFKAETGIAAGFTAQEAADLFTPIIAMPLAVLILELVARPSLRMRLLFVAVIALWVLGQGMHLATNAIGDVAGKDPAFYSSSPGLLDEWLDEVLSHWIWHAAWVGLLVLTFVAARAGPPDARPAGGRAAMLAAVAGALHGFTWFVVTIEGVTAALGIPAAAVLLLLPLAQRPANGTRWVFARFLLVSSAVALLLYTLWAALNNATLPEVTPMLGL